MKRQGKQNNNSHELPEIHDNELVEYSEELADGEDKEAQARAEAAEQRVKNKDK